jgi:UDP-MurNAc hydroxylase
MKITHLQSSTQIVDVNGVKLLTDPWLTDGEYYGSWYHYPPFPMKKIGDLDYDFIYVSHIHPDHLSEETFKCLPKKVPVLIHNYESKFVKRKLEILGFEVIETNHGQPYLFPNGGSITIYAADNCDPELCGRFLGCGKLENRFQSTQIDTMVLIEHSGERILNTNDCPYELLENTIVKNKINNLKIDLLLVGYAGAGPYPQCFEFKNEYEKEAAAHSKKMQFLGQSIKYINLLNPKRYTLFAGTYILGSRLVHYNRFRGVPSIKEAIEYIDSKVSSGSTSISLEQFDSLDLGLGVKTIGCRSIDKSLEEYSIEIGSKGLAYDADQWDDAELEDLLKKAYFRFKSKTIDINYQSDTYVIIQTNLVAFKFNRVCCPEFIKIDAVISHPFVKISLNHNLLHRLLRGPKYAHWNNAEIGSHLNYHRIPNFFERGLHHCLCFFHN